MQKFNPNTTKSEKKNEKAIIYYKKTQWYNNKLEKIEFRPNLIEYEAARKRKVNIRRWSKAFDVS